MYVLPQEIEVWYVIPAVRKEFAIQLVKEKSMSFEKTGQILGISKTAVSQYLSNKRANKLRLPATVKKEIRKSVDIVMKEPKRIVKEIERILKIVKQNRCSCGVCIKYNPEIKKYCDCNPLC